MAMLRALGTTIDVDLNGSPIDEGEFTALWDRCLVEPAAMEASDVVETVHAEGNSSLVILTQHITHALIAARRGELLMLHAGAVAHQTTGRALAFVAPGGTGKSTLTRLLAREYGYLTDETVGLDPATLEIFPYPKPITWAAVKGEPKIEHAPDSFGLQAAPPRPWLGDLVVLRRTPDREPSFTELGVLDAIERLVPESSSVTSLPRPLHVLADVHRRAGCTLIEYGEADDILDWCRARLETP
ncbi:hypothetical protein [Tessaracoccus flavus]|uniref:Uncharacterized protein n=1 Tax=Tessaracoccus flavus TaxID=1610493 RepID=A0A1Q2CHK9_9ACTN|nr:hypothetical protein [Tessaracoccus flavus]AQP45550.1 hypothetical protein RPIT_12655 [Tessaracoccus flavus]SDY79316.1 hypothetical protein SAMN05428934_104155 [Tessaracoccus flavus]